MLVYDDPTETIGVEVGEQFSIKLETSPTTGYDWQEQVHNPDMVELLETRYELPEVPSMGGSAHAFFEFSAKEAGDTTISFNYQRAWGDTTPRDTMVFSIRVR